MARVRVRLLGVLSEEAGWFEKELELPGEPTVGDLLETLYKHHPGLREYLEDEDSPVPAVILVNGRSIEYLEGKKTRLHDGDRVAIIPPAGGGC